MTRSTSIMRVVLFPLACAPMFIGLPGGHPLLNAAFALGVTLIFLRWDRRSPAVLGLEFTWRPLRGLVTGLGVGTLVISAIALGMWAVLVSSRLLEYELWNRLHARGSAVTRGDPARELLQRSAPHGPLGANGCAPTSGCREPTRNRFSVPYR